MTKTLRGANSRVTSFFARRESAKIEEHFAPSEAEATQEEEIAASEEEGTVEVSDAQKAALNEFTVAQLKERLASLGKPTSGKKADLIARLLEV